MTSGSRCPYNNMDSNVKELIYSSGADEKLSSLLIEFTGGDVEGAKKIIEAMPKDYIAVKVRYMAHKAHCYGVLLLVVDLKHQSIENISLVANNNKAASQIDNTLKYSKFKEKITDYIRKTGNDMDTMSRLREAINVEDFSGMMFSKFKDNKFDKEQLKVVFSELFSRVLADQNCAVKIETEEVDIFSVHKSDNSYNVNKSQRLLDNEKEEDQNESQKARKEEVQIRNISLVILKIEPVVAPVMGVPALDLQPGDDILVKIIDEREIGDYLTKLLGGKENGELVPIHAAIKEISKKEDIESLMIIVEFGPGIAGKMFISPEIKVEVSGLSEEKKGERSEAFKVNFLWIIFFLIVFFFIILFFTIFVNK